MASSVQPLIQMALHSCRIHQHEELDMYCRSCKKSICNDCAKANHLTHNWLPMSTYAKKLRGKAQIKALEVNSVADSIYKGHTKMSDYWKEINERECSKTLSELEDIRSRLHGLIDEIVNDRKKKVKNLHDEREKKLAFQNLTKEWEKLKKMTEQLQEESGTLSAPDIIELYVDIENSLSTITSKCSEESYQQFKYIKGEVDKKTLEKMVGNITKVSARVPDVSLPPLKEWHFKKYNQDGNEATEKDQEDNAIYCIRPISDFSAWLSHGGDVKPLNIDLAAVTKETLNAKLLFYDFDISRTGNLFCGVPEEKALIRINKAGELQPLFKTFPFIPVSIDITHSGDLLVSLVDEDQCRRSSTSRRLVKRMTERGYMMAKLRYLHDHLNPWNITMAKSVSSMILKMRRKRQWVLCTDLIRLDMCNTNITITMKNSIHRTSALT